MSNIFHDDRLALGERIATGRDRVRGDNPKMLQKLRLKPGLRRQSQALRGRVIKLQRTHVGTHQFHGGIERGLKQFWHFGFAGEPEGQIVQASQGRNISDAARFRFLPLAHFPRQAPLCGGKLGDARLNALFQVIA